MLTPVRLLNNVLVKVLALIHLLLDDVDEVPHNVTILQCGTFRSANSVFLLPVAFTKHTTVKC